MASPPPNVTFNLTGVGVGNVLGGVYTSPYAGNINGGSTVSVICDDYADESFLPESWTAYMTQLSQVLGETSTDTYLKWTTGWNGTGSMAAPLELDQIQAYSAAAILAIDVLSSSGVTQEEYSYAMWELFDPTDASAALNGTGDQSTVAGMVQAAASDAVNGTINGGSLATYLSNYNVTIYSYDTQLSNAHGACSPNCPPPQEFITVSMAEPSSPALLFFDLLGVAGLVFFVRRRFVVSRNLNGD